VYQIYFLDSYLDFDGGHLNDPNRTINSVVYEFRYESFMRGRSAVSFSCGIMTLIFCSACYEITIVLIINIRNIYIYIFLNNIIYLMINNNIIDVYKIEILYLKINLIVNEKIISIANNTYIYLINLIDIGK
jgi:hypothetical protein